MSILESLNPFSGVYAWFKGLSRQGTIDGVQEALDDIAAGRVKFRLPALPTLPPPVVEVSQEPTTVRPALEMADDSFEKPARPGNGRKQKTASE